MSRSGRNYGKKPPDIGLQMECHDEALTPEQAAAYNKGEKEYKEVTAKLEQMMKNLGAEIIEKSDSVYVLQMNNRCSIIIIIFICICIACLLLFF
jgi:hypothetical protein